MNKIGRIALAACTALIVTAAGSLGKGLVERALASQPAPTPTPTPVPTALALVPVASPTASPTPDVPADPQETPAKPAKETIVSGYVIHRDTSVGIRGAEIIVQTQPASVGQTDDFGYFKIRVPAKYRGGEVNVLIRKAGFNKRSATIAIDESGTTLNDKYTVEPLSTASAPASETVELAGNSRIPVATKMVIKENSQVTISATGSVTMGQMIGSSEPVGSPNVFLSSVIGTQSKVVQQYRMGTLLWRFAGKGAKWSGYNGDTTFTAAYTGKLEFLVNDNQRDNNTGAYKILIKARKS